MEKGRQPFADAGVAKLLQGRVLELANTLTAEAQFLTDLVQRPGLAVPQAEAKPDDPALAVAQDAERPFQLRSSQVVERGIGRRGAPVVGNQLVQFTVVVIHRLVE